LFAKYTLVLGGHCRWHFDLELCPGPQCSHGPKPQL